MTNQHPITPPPELVLQWEAVHFRNCGWVDASRDTSGIRKAIAAAAAQWGADQELEACCAWLMYENDRQGLRAARRPKTPSLKEQALNAMGRFTTNAHTRADEMAQDFDTIRRALEALPND